MSLLTRQEEVAYLNDMIKRHEKILETEEINAIYDQNMSRVFEIERKLAQLHGQLKVAENRNETN